MEKEARLKLEQTQGWQVAKKFFGEPSFNQNAHGLAEHINEAISEAVAETEADKVVSIGRANGKAELLAACKAALNYMPHTGEPALLKQLREAIVKAGGTV